MHSAAAARTMTVPGQGGQGIKFQGGQRLEKLYQDTARDFQHSLKLGNPNIATNILFAGIRHFRKATALKVQPTAFKKQVIAINEQFKTLANQLESDLIRAFYQIKNNTSIPSATKKHLLSDTLSNTLRIPEFFGNIKGVVNAKILIALWNEEEGCIQSAISGYREVIELSFRHQLSEEHSTASGRLFELLIGEASELQLAGKDLASKKFFSEALSHGDLKEAVNTMIAIAQKREEEGRIQAARSVYREVIELSFQHRLSAEQDTASAGLYELQMREGEKSLKDKDYVTSSRLFISAFNLSSKHLQRRAVSGNNAGIALLRGYEATSTADKATAKGRQLLKDTYYFLLESNKALSALLTSSNAKRLLEAKAKQDQQIREVEALLVHYQ